MKSNIRFGVHINGTVTKLTLSPGQTLVYETGGPTDEGYHYTAYSWSLSNDGHTLYRTIDVDARDCDGRLTKHNECRAGRSHVFDIESHEGMDINIPDWDTIGSSQRDYAAERMGY